jgi:hypothetical protein
MPDAMTQGFSGNYHTITSSRLDCFYNEIRFHAFAFLDQLPTNTGLYAISASLAQICHPKQLHLPTSFRKLNLLRLANKLRFCLQPMNDYSDIPLVQACYQLSMDLHLLAKRLPRQERYLSGAELRIASTKILDVLIKANHCDHGQDRLENIADANALLISLRLRIRLLKDLRMISPGTNAVLNSQIEHILRQLSGWRKWSSSQKADSTLALSQTF